MVIKLLSLFFKSARMARTIDYACFPNDPDYPQTLIRELCGEQDGGWSDSRVSRDGKIVDPVRRAA